MRKARRWFATGFSLKARRIFINILVNEHSAEFRMVASYWGYGGSIRHVGSIMMKMFNASIPNMSSSCQA